MKRLEKIWNKKTRIALGLMSGTSVDGIDVVLTEISGKGWVTRARILAFETYPFDPQMRGRILKLFSGRAEEICEMNFILGELFAESALKLIHVTGFHPKEIDMIGSHGLTVYHLSGAKDRRNSSLQIGEGAVIAARTGIITVYDFRPADIAVGGTGAPLVPYADYLLFRKKGKIRALLNLGGIANVTVVPFEFKDVLAFDTGPGNMIIDGLIRMKSRGKRKYDCDGRISAQGKVMGPLLEELLRHPYLSRKPPKSTGREIFGEGFVRALWERGKNLCFEDLLATATYFTAASVGRSFQKFILPRFRVDEIYVSGGGMHNRTLLGFLSDVLRPIPLKPLNELGVEGDAKEALAFALLADATLQGSASNVPGATGARRPVVLGKIIL